MVEIFKNISTIKNFKFNENTEEQLIGLIMNNIYFKDDGTLICLNRYNRYSFSSKHLI